MRKLILIALAIAFLVGLWVVSRQAKRAGLDANRITDMAVWVLIAGLIGAKLLLVAVDWRYFGRNPREIGSILQSGGVFYGGLIGGILVAWWYVRRHRLPGHRPRQRATPVGRRRRRRPSSRTAMTRTAGPPIRQSRRLALR